MLPTIYYVTNTSANIQDTHNQLITINTIYISVRLCFTAVRKRYNELTIEIATRIAIEYLLQTSTSLLVQV